MSAVTDFGRAVAVMVWDATGVVLFVVWLLLPLAYTVVLGRKYVRQARAAAEEAANAAQEAAWANEDVQEALDGLEEGAKSAGERSGLTAKDTRGGHTGVASRSGNPRLSAGTDFTRHSLHKGSRRDAPRTPT